MNNHLFYLLIVFFCFSASAEISELANDQIVMSRESINQFLDSSNRLTELRQKLPKITEYSDEKAAQSSAKMIAFLEASTIFPEIKSILASTELTNLTEFFQFSERLMAMKLHLQLENSAQATIFQTVKILRANLNSMKANRASTKIIQQAEKLLTQQEQKATLIQSSLDKLTERDKTFAKQNQQWLIELFSQ